jgi:hypothetical protein
MQEGQRSPIRFNPNRTTLRCNQNKEDPESGERKEANYIEGSFNKASS